MIAVEGRRERKRRETRERIIHTAIELFLQHGYEATTMDDIADAADVSRRSLFDYFPGKEDVAFARQDDFVPTLVDELRQRPAHEAWPVLVEHALTRAVVHAATSESVAIDALVRRTPALHPRQQLNYARIERAIAEALAERSRGTLKQPALFAAVVVAGFRVATTDPADVLPADKIQRGVARDFKALWRSLRDFGEAGLESARGISGSR